MCDTLSVRRVDEIASRAMSLTWDSDPIWAVVEALGHVHSALDGGERSQDLLRIIDSQDFEALEIVRDRFITIIQSDQYAEEDL